MKEKINDRDTEGRTALYMAALEGKTEAVQALLSAGANLNVTMANDDAVTPLHLAAFNGHLEVVCALLAAGANPNMIAKDGTALSGAVFRNYPEVIRVLVNHPKVPVESIRRAVQKLDPEYKKNIAEAMRPNRSLDGGKMFFKVGLAVLLGIVLLPLIIPVPFMIREAWRKWQVAQRVAEACKLSEESVQPTEGENLEQQELPSAGKIFALSWAQGGLFRENQKVRIDATADKKTLSPGLE